MFKFYPRLGSAINGIATIVDIVLYEKGNVHICFAKITQEDIPEAIPWQIYMGYDSMNYNCLDSAVLEGSPVPQ